MVNLRCSKCGSHAGFLIETSNGKTLEVKGQLGVERIQATVRVTCTYCNAVWDHAPMKLVDNSVESRMGRHVMH
jgi:DNA-directed RNA polymerase subunit RPC12/RpoP